MRAGAARTAPDPAEVAAACAAGPLWQAGLPASAGEDAPPPAAADVAVIGAGVTGLSAALHLARAGRKVVVFDAGRPGHGATTRNAGVLGWTLTATPRQLARHPGAEEEARQAFRALLDFVAEEGIACDLSLGGRIILARSEGAFRHLRASLEERRRRHGDAHEILGPAELGKVFGGRGSVGGARIAAHGTLHPGLFLAGLLARVRAAGASVQSCRPITACRPEGAAVRLSYPEGSLRADRVVLAANAYCDAAFPWFRRRLLAVPGFMVATEPLPPDVIRACLPGGDCFHDHAGDAEYGRTAERGRRLVFGGLTGADPRELGGIAHRLAARMVRRFPALEGVRLAHAWTGSCAATRGGVPQIGIAQGVHFALGYAFGSGLPLGLWLGRRLAAGIIDGRLPQSAFAGRPLSLFPLVSAQGWVRPLIRPLLALRRLPD